MNKLKCLSLFTFVFFVVVPLRGAGKACTSVGEVGEHEPLYEANQKAMVIKVDHNGELLFPARAPFAFSNEKADQSRLLQQIIASLPTISDDVLSILEKYTNSTRNNLLSILEKSCADSVSFRNTLLSRIAIYTNSDPVDLSPLLKIYTHSVWEVPEDQNKYLHALLNFIDLHSGKFVIAQPDGLYTLSSEENRYPYLDPSRPQHEEQHELEVKNNLLGWYLVTQGIVNHPPVIDSLRVTRKPESLCLAVDTFTYDTQNPSRTHTLHFGALSGRFELTRINNAALDSAPRHKDPMAQ